MADAIFEETRLAEIYDLTDHPDRPDLEPWPQSSRHLTRGVLEATAQVAA